MKKALSMTDLMRKHREVYAFEGEWQEAFGQPEQNGVWFIWGRSGNGKTSFLLQLCKELTRYGKVAYDSLEEGDSLTMQNALIRVGMGDVGRQFVLLNESLKELDTRLKRRRSPNIVVVDSFQYAHINLKEYEEFIDLHKKKLIIFVSQADGTKPLGRTAQSAMYSASLKIWVEGYRAISKGRYFGDKGYFTIWEERAAKYWKKAKRNKRKTKQ
ncbi:DNA repair protein RadA family protein [Prevotella intermedia]|uniref:ATP-dependent serine protease n=1 Tax=Prevotella intermedia TaxID=28131 RepID=A0A2M8TWI4_PREIN|nr:ATP-dependent serine protease [Prevotella intermedia]PJI28242.1 ATP-dependent serine protease [Prevotella intermedia]